MVDPVTMGPVRTLPQSSRPSTSGAARIEATPAQAANSAPSLPKLVGMATELAQQGPPVDYAKIAQIRQAIAKGEYSVDVETIAHSMIGFFRSDK